jgi:hypothetical protein
LEIRRKLLLLCIVHLRQMSFASPNCLSFVGVSYRHIVQIAGSLDGPRDSDAQGFLVIYLFQVYAVVTKLRVPTFYSTPSVSERMSLENRICLTNTLSGRCGTEWY